MREQVAKLECPICNKPYRGKIGVGVHLVRSHTSEERAKLFLARIMAMMPLIITIVAATIATRQPIEEEKVQ